MWSKVYDLIIIGGGPGGYVSAIRAAQLGKQVALVERDQLGGVCLNWGCIPTKSLLESAETYRSIVDAGKMGIECGPAVPNIKMIVARSREIVKQLTNGVQYLMKKNKIDIYYGHGRLYQCDGDYKLVEIQSKDNTEHIKATKMIIATGGRNRYPRGVHVDGARVWDCRHAMTTDVIPKTIIIVGGGAIGLEFASFFNALGSKVTVIEYADRIISYADKEISEYALKSFKENGIQFVLGQAIDFVKANEKEVVVKTVAAELGVYDAEYCLIATGIIGNTEDIGLENAPNVVVEGGSIVTGIGSMTGHEGIYAIGDVAVTGPWLAHKATQEGIRCVENMFNENKVNDLLPHEIPICVYSIPQIAQIGLTEGQAISRGCKIKVKTYSLAHNGKALTEDNNGIIKVILEEDTGIFIGAHMVGKHVTELISNYGLIQHLEGLPEDVHYTTFPHPTLSEMIQESIIGVDGHGIHVS